jgi:hypothetical protein
MYRTSVAKADADSDAAATGILRAAANIDSPTVQTINSNARQQKAYASISGGAFRFLHKNWKLQRQPNSLEMHRFEASPITNTYSSGSTALSEPSANLSGHGSTHANAGL